MIISNHKIQYQYKHKLHNIYIVGVIGISKM